MMKEKDIKDKFGRRLRRMRMDRGLSLEDLAARIGSCKDTIQRWEMGLWRPQLRFMRPLARALQVELEEILV